MFPPSGTVSPEIPTSVFVISLHATKIEISDPTASVCVCVCVCVYVCMYVCVCVCTSANGDSNGLSV